MPGFFYVTLYSDSDGASNIHHDPLYVYKASIYPDTLYLHEALNTKYWTESRIVIQKKTDNRMEGIIFSVVHRAKVLKTATVLPAVWKIKRKRDIKTGIIKKYKSHLNINGSRMQKSIHHDQ